MIAARLIETRKSASRSARKAPSAVAASHAEGRLQKSSKASKPQSEAEARVSPQEELHVLKAAQARHRRLLDRKIEFVSGLEFRTGDQEPAVEAGAFDEPVSDKAAPKGLPAYLAGLYATTLLTREDEADLFRRMNLLKFQAVAGRDALDAERPDSAAMDAIEALLREAEDIRNRIIRSNLRLVVSIAKKYVDPVVTFDELVSDGNESLIRAVEKFDYARGFRFSTYATWAIRRNFFRQITDRRKRKSRFLGSDEAGIEDRAFTPDTDELNEREYESIRGLMGAVIDRLSDREQQIVRLRFGLDRETRPHTLQQIGVVLGVSKERVRQIEGRAIDKLRKLLADNETELLLRIAGTA